MLTREHVQNILNIVINKSDYAEFQKHLVSDFVYEFMGTQPCAGLWVGPDAVKRQFTAFNENFTTEFGVEMDELFVDPEKNAAALRLHSHPLTDLGGGEYRQHCAWFIYFNNDGKITRIVDYSDTKLVDEMTLRVETARMNNLKKAQAAAKRTM